MDLSVAGLSTFSTLIYIGSLVGISIVTVAIYLWLGRENRTTVRNHSEAAAKDLLGSQVGVPLKKKNSKHKPPKKPKEVSIQTAPMKKPAVEKVLPAKSVAPLKSNVDEEKELLQLATLSKTLVKSHKAESVSTLVQKKQIDKKPLPVASEDSFFRLLDLVTSTLLSSADLQKFVDALLTKQSGNEWKSSEFKGTTVEDLEKELKGKTQELIDQKRLTQVSLDRCKSLKADLLVETNAKKAIEKTAMDQIMNLTAEIQLLKTSMNMAKQELDESRSIISSLKHFEKAYPQLQDKLEKAMQTVQSSETERNLLSRQLSLYSSKQSELVSINDNLKIHVQKFESAQNYAKEQIKSLRDETAAMQKMEENSKKKLKEITAELNILKQNEDEANSAAILVKDLRYALQEKEKQILKLQQSIESGASSHAEKSKQCDELSFQIVKMNQAASIFETQLAEKDHLIRKLQQEAESHGQIVEKLSQLLENHHNLQSELDMKNDRILVAENQISSLQTSLEELTSERDSLKMAAKHVNQQEHDESQKLKQELEDIKKKHVELSAQKELVDSRFVKLTKELEDLRSEWKDQKSCFEQQLSSSLDTIREKDSVICKFEEAVELLSEELKDSISDRENVEVELTSMRESLVSAFKSVNGFRDLKRKYQDTIEELNGKLEEKHSECEKLTNTADSLREEISRSRNQLEIAQSELSRNKSNGSPVSESYEIVGNHRDIKSQQSSHQDQVDALKTLNQKLLVMLKDAKKKVSELESVRAPQEFAAGEE